MSSHQACCGTMFWVYLMSCAGLVMFAGLMSGLTLGLMSLSLVDLEVLAKAGTPQDQLNAARILPVVKNQHLLLCALLIGNALAMEALPIFLDSLVPSFGAVLISVTLILAFSEVSCLIRIATNNLAETGNTMMSYRAHLAWKIIGCSQ